MKEDYDYSDLPESTHHVIADGEWIPLSKTTFIDISEDPTGRDIYEFEYKGKTYRSFCIMKYEN
jgi:hypothetical protein